MEKQFDFNAVPRKVFVDTVHIRIINGMLHLAVQSGQEISCLILPLPLGKLVGRAVTKQIEEIETKNKIRFDDRLPNEPMLSPWTSQKPDDENSEKKGE